MERDFDLAAKNAAAANVNEDSERPVPAGAAR